MRKCCPPSMSRLFETRPCRAPVRSWDLIAEVRGYPEFEVDRATYEGVSHPVKILVTYIHRLLARPVCARRFTVPISGRKPSCAHLRILSGDLLLNPYAVSLTPVGTSTRMYCVLRLTEERSSGGLPLSKVQSESLLSCFPSFLSLESVFRIKVLPLTCPLRNQD